MRGQLGAVGRIYGGRVRADKDAAEFGQVINRLWQQVAELCIPLFVGPRTRRGAKQHARVRPDVNSLEMMRCDWFAILHCHHDGRPDERNQVQLVRREPLTLIVQWSVYVRAHVGALGEPPDVYG